jgi:hypothetical protein
MDDLTKIDRLTMVVYPQLSSRLSEVWNHSNTTLVKREVSRVFGDNDKIKVMSDRKFIKFAENYLDDLGDRNDQSEITSVVLSILLEVKEDNGYFAQTFIDDIDETMYSERWVVFFTNTFSRWFHRNNCAGLFGIHTDREHFQQWLVTRFVVYHEYFHYCESNRMLATQSDTVIQYSENSANSYAWNRLIEDVLGMANQGETNG